MNTDLRLDIDNALRELTYREREVIKLRYGLEEGTKYTLEECGRIFRMTRERVRRIQAKAELKLSKLLGDNWVSEGVKP